MNSEVINVVKINWLMKNSFLDWQQSWNIILVLTIKCFHYIRYNYWLHNVLIELTADGAKLLLPY